MRKTAKRIVMFFVKILFLLGAMGWFVGLKVAVGGDVRIGGIVMGVSCGLLAASILVIAVIDPFIAYPAYCFVEIDGCIFVVKKLKKGMKCTVYPQGTDVDFLNKRISVSPEVAESMLWHAQNGWERVYNEALEMDKGRH